MVYFYGYDENEKSLAGDPVTAEEILGFFDANIDPGDEESIRANRGLLYRYAATPGLLDGLIERSLREGHEVNDDGFMLTNQSIIIQSKGAYVLRMNFWSNPSSDAAHSDREKLLLSYETPHDHNFSLLTIGCYGPGYCTKIRQYDRSQVNGQVDENLNLTEETTFRLGKNDMMFYEASRDVHEQLIPESLSVSLNLIAQEPSLYKSAQFFIDFSGSRIAGYPDSRTGKYLHLLNIVEPMAHLYQSEISEIVEKCDEPVILARAVKLLDHCKEKMLA